MKSFASIFILFFTSIILAMVQPPELNGNFQFNLQKTKALSLKHQMTIYSVSAEGKDLIKQFKALNYICQNVDARLVQCSQFIKNATVNEAVLSRLHIKLSGAELKFEQAIGSAELVNEAEMIFEWEQQQAAQWNGTKFHKIQFRYLKPEKLMKFNLLAENGDKAYFLFQDGAISMTHFESIKLVPTNKNMLNETEIYFLQLGFDQAR